MTPSPKHNGFTLVELSIVLIIIALITGGLLVSLSTQQEGAARSATEKRLTETIEALTGFAAANQRLPCPASSTSSGREAFCEAASGACTETLIVQSHGRCSAPYNGFIPAVTLSLQPTSAQGQLLDAWNNPIRYAVTEANANSFTIAKKMSENWSGGLTPDLSVCSTGVGIAGGNCAAGTALTETAVAVVYSRGKNGGTAPSSTDEVANGADAVADKAFVSHTQTPASSGNEFDDLVIWLSPNILYNRLIAVGRLP